MLSNGLVVRAAADNVRTEVQNMNHNLRVVFPLLDATMVPRAERQEESPIASGFQEEEFGDAFVNHELARQLCEALARHGESQLLALLCKQAVLTPARKAYAEVARHRAREEDEQDVDDNPPVAFGEGGANVVVWHWIEEEDIDIKPDEDAG